MDSNDLGHPSGPPCRARLDPVGSAWARLGFVPLGADWLAEGILLTFLCLRWELSAHEVRIGRGERVKIDTAGSRGVQRCEKKLWIEKKDLLD